MAERYTLSWLAQELEVDRRWLARELDGLAPDEILDHAGGSSPRWKLSRVFQHLKAKGVNRGEDVTDPRNRLAAAQADKHEMENELRRGELLEAAEARSRWAGYVLNCRAKLLSLPTSVATRLINIADPNTIVRILREYIYAALDELAADGADERDQRHRGNGATVAQPADSDDQPVG
jgi:phage terminase Nu1 subunit (DNA packaging protein)